MIEIKNSTAIKGFAILLFAMTAVSCKNSLETEITIDEPSERVWDIFSDTKSYETWNPMILNFTGEMKQDAQIKVKLKLPGENAMEFTPRIIEFEKGRLLEWKGVYIAEWIFTGSHRFELERISDHKTTFKHSEKFSGIAVPFFDFSNTKIAFENMNKALKNRAEEK